MASHKAKKHASVLINIVHLTLSSHADARECSVSPLDSVVPAQASREYRRHRQQFLAPLVAGVVSGDRLSLTTLPTLRGRHPLRLSAPRRPCAGGTCDQTVSTTSCVPPT